MEACDREVGLVVLLQNRAGQHDLTIGRYRHGVRDRAQLISVDDRGRGLYGLKADPASSLQIESPVLAARQNEASLSVDRDGVDGHAERVETAIGTEAAEVGVEVARRRIYRGYVQGGEKKHACDDGACARCFSRAKTLLDRAQRLVRFESVRSESDHRPRDPATRLGLEEVHPSGGRQGITRRC